MSSTFTGPIRIFARNNPSNDGTIAPDNTGAAVVSQQVAIEANAVASVVIPAGSIIQSVTGYFNVVGTSRDVLVDSTVVGTIDTSDLGVTAAVFTQSAPVANLLANVGPADVTVSVSSEAGSAGVLSVVYTARNANGTITPYGSGYTNN